MPQRTVTLASRHGLHARPAALFVKAAAAQAVPVRIGVPGGRRADARSILAVLALKAGHGAQVVLEADGDGADQALDTLAALLETDHDDDGPDGDGSGGEPGSGGGAGVGRDQEHTGV